MTVQPLIDLWSRGYFPIGLLFGVIGLAVGGVSVAARRAQGPTPIGGALLLVAALLGLAVKGLLPSGALAGFVLLGVAGVATLRSGLLWRTVLALPGAVVLASTLPDRAAWVPVLVVAVTVLGGQLVVDFDRRHGQLACLFVAISAAGIYVTVPDTEAAAVVAGAALPLALLGWPIVSATLGRPSCVAVTGLLAWTAATGGRGRESAVVGGIACLGLLVAEPLSRLAGNSGLRPLFRHRAPVDAVLAGSFHAALVYVAARVAGLRLRVLPCAAIVVVELAAVLLFDAALGMQRDRETRR